MVVKSKIVFPKAKINLGLRLVDKRQDGYHNLESIFLKIPLYDIIEIHQYDGDGSIHLSTSGIDIPGLSDENLITRVFKAYCKATGQMINVDVHLHKRIPIGAGLGGGSSDASYFIRALNEMNNGCLSDRELTEIVSQFGSDCAFFLKDTPQFVRGIGNDMEDFNVKLEDVWLYLVYPNIHIDTIEAYKNCQVSGLSLSINSLSIHSSDNWTDLKNDFEKTVFKELPAIEEVKKKLLSAGAFYASMSGSGSSVYGLFHEKPGFSFEAVYFSTIVQL